jgi:acetoin utilization protein AcuC
VNVPVQPYTGDDSWLAAVKRVVPALAEAFAPTFLVTQHGCDTHVYDPLAHLRLTTRAYREATLMLDEIAHTYAEGRWLATGGGGYDAYRVVPRSWSLVWLAQAHRDPPAATDAAWRERWAAEAERFGQSPPPDSFVDPAKLVAREPNGVAEANARTADQALSGALEALKERSN